MDTGYLFNKSVCFWLDIGEEGRGELIDRQRELLEKVVAMPEETHEDKERRVVAYARGWQEIEREIARKYIKADDEKSSLPNQE